LHSFPFKDERKKTKKKAYLFWSLAKTIQVRTESRREIGEISSLFFLIINMCFKNKTKKMQK
jgi:hypothetical protein